MIANPMENAELQQIQKWKQQGKTKAFMIGRFQGLHEGHIALISKVLESGLELHIRVPEVCGTPDGKNPYSFEQRKHMLLRAFPQLKLEHIHRATTNISASKGDVGEQLERQMREIGEFASPDNSVFFYGRRAEDIHDYIVHGITHHNIHYADLIASRGYDIQHVDSGVTKSGTLFRCTGDANMIPETHRAFLFAQHELAKRVGRPVGASQEKDPKRVDGIAVPSEPINRGDWQKQMLLAGKEVTIPGPKLGR
jgi:cytidyltransferase-like protein